MVKEKAIKLISENLKKILKKWDGKRSILDMKNNGGRHWKQMEWIGWYFEFLCERYLKDVMEFHKIKYGNTDFDGFLEVPFDFKTHISNSKVKDVVINDKEAILNALRDYGYIIVIISLGEAEYNDLDRTFYKWHEEVKGGKSKYEFDRIKRKAPSRLRKMSFDIREIIFVKLDENTLKKCKLFQENFRNADGSPRRPKFKINPDDLEEKEIIERVEF